MLKKRQFPSVRRTTKLTRRLKRLLMIPIVAGLMSFGCYGEDHQSVHRFEDVGTAHLDSQFFDTPQIKIQKNEIGCDEFLEYDLSFFNNNFIEETEEGVKIYNSEVLLPEGYKFVAEWRVLGIENLEFSYKIYGNGNEINTKDCEESDCVLVNISKPVERGVGEFRAEIVIYFEVDERNGYAYIGIETDCCFWIPTPIEGCYKL